MVQTGATSVACSRRRVADEGMVRAFPLYEPARPENFDEDRYVAANPDVRAALQSGACESGQSHFEAFGRDEDRRQLSEVDVPALRRVKLERLGGRLRTDLEHSVDAEGRFDFLTDALRAETRIVDTDRVSANAYDSNAQALIERCADGMVLDCGAGSRGDYFPHVLNFEIVPYRSTDVLGVGEHLPFADDTFDAVLSLTVLEHVRDPFRCASEIVRVLKPGGDLICVMPFLQPMHGYPHHYFNATPQGVRRLFEDSIDVADVLIPDQNQPIWALNWILNSWTAGLPEDRREAFRNMTVAELSGALAELEQQDFCRLLSPEAQFELACATMLIGTKPKG